MLQFLKGSWKYSKSRTALPRPHHQAVGSENSFVIDPDNPDPGDIEVARRAWEVSKEALFSGEYGMVILDEINGSIAYGLLPVDEVVAALSRKRPPQVHVVLTGRMAHPKIIEMADLVTEMTEIKHPWRAGHNARKGIEF